jgi:hypothetical protein
MNWSEYGSIWILVSTRIHGQINSGFTFSGKITFFYFLEKERGLSLWISWNRDTSHFL